PVPGGGREEHRERPHRVDEREQPRLDLSPRLHDPRDHAHQPRRSGAPAPWGIPPVLPRGDPERARGPRSSDGPGPAASPLRRSAGQHVRASKATSCTEAGPPSGTVAVTVAEPASTDAARTANDWYAAAPGATPAAVREPYGVSSVTSSATSSALVARTATYARPARQRACAATVTSGPGSSASNASACHVATSSAVRARPKTATRSTAPRCTSPPPWFAPAWNGRVRHPAIASTPAIAPPARASPPTNTVMAPSSPIVTTRSNPRPVGTWTGVVVPTPAVMTRTAFDGVRSIRMPSASCPTGWASNRRRYDDTPASMRNSPANDAW